MSPEHPNLAAALVAALAEVPLVGADHKANAGSYSYDYADLAGVVKASRPVLAEHGVVALTPVVEHGDGLACTVILLHSSGERMDLGPFPFPHGKDAQATGSMVTYHRRYALLSALGMAVGDDDDGAAAKPRQKQAAEPAQAPDPVEAEGGWATPEQMKELKKMAAILDDESVAKWPVVLGCEVVKDGKINITADAYADVWQRLAEYDTKPVAESVPA